MLYFPRWKIALILLVVLAASSPCIPNFFSTETVARWPSWLPKRQIVLGLDLRGGAHLLLRGRPESLVTDRLEPLTATSARRSATTRIGYRGLAIARTRRSLQLRDPDDAPDDAGACSRLQRRSSPGSSGGAAINELDRSADMATASRDLTDAGADARMRSASSTQCDQVIDRRINALGTTEPSIQRQGTTASWSRCRAWRPQRAEAISARRRSMTFHLVQTRRSAIADSPPPAARASSTPRQSRPSMLETRR